MPSTPQTLVFHTGALGDSVLIWPVLRSLADKGPILFIAARDKARLAQRWIPGVSADDGDTPDFSRLFAPAAELEISQTLGDLLRSATQIISFISRGEDHWARNIKAIAPSATTVFVAARPGLHERTPITQFHARQLREQGVGIEPLDPESRPRLLDAPILIHPGSGGRDKCWPADRFEILLDHLRAIGRPASLVIGEVELERMERALIDHWQKRFEVIAPADLLELAEHITRCSLFVGNDSGPTHLAAQMGIPTLALMGPTDPRIWSPRGPAVTVLAPPKLSPMTWLDVDRVIEAVARG